MDGGFTLAEVLITLGIIGVIAAITMPTLVANYQKKALTAQLKKAYSVFSQAMALASMQDGDLSSAIVTNNSQESINNWYKNYIKPHIKVVKECYSETGCWAKGVKNLGGITPYCDSGEKGIGNTDGIITFTTIDGYNFCLDAFDNYGMRFGVKSENDNSDVLGIFIDVNGNKRPNVVGKDIYFFIFSPSRGLVPAGNDLSDNEVSDGCSSSDKSVYSGYYCSAKIIRNGWNVDN